MRIRMFTQDLVNTCLSAFAFGFKNCITSLSRYMIVRYFGLSENGHYTLADLGIPLSLDLANMGFDLYLNYL